MTLIEYLEPNGKEERGWRKEFCVKGQSGRLSQ